MRIHRLKFLLIIMAFTSLAQEASAQMKPQLNHIAVYVKDLSTSARFYGELIGLDTIPEPFHDGRHAWFNLGGVGQLHVISGATAAIEKNKNNHLCFSVPDIEVFIARLNKNGISFENWLGEKSQTTLRPDGKKQIWFQDPDGYWIEVNNDY